MLGRYQTISSVFLAFIIELACRQTNSGQKSLLNALVKVELKNNTVSPLIVAVPVDVKERCAEHAMLYTQPLCIRTRTFQHTYIGLIQYAQVILLTLNSIEFF